MKSIVLTICFVVLITGTNSIFWSRRRRRRSPPPCNARNCQVGSWTSWSSCSHQCGTSGSQTRIRQKLQAAQCGGTCPYKLQETQACNRGNCKHGGTPNNAGCSCRVGYGGRCCQQGEVNERKTVLLLRPLVWAWGKLLNESTACLHRGKFSPNCFSSSFAICMIRFRILRRRKGNNLTGGQTLICSRYYFKTNFVVNREPLSF